VESGRGTFISEKKKKNKTGCFYCWI